MFQSYPGRRAGLHRQAQRDALASAVRPSRPGTRTRTAWSRAGARLNRLAAALVAVTVGLLASVAAIPAAFAREMPAGLATVHQTSTSGGLSTWQIVLIGVGFPLALAVVAGVLWRVRATHRHAPSPTA
jgi:hypothetical protein